MLKGSEVVEFRVDQVELRHLVASLDTAGLRLHPGDQRRPCAFGVLPPAVADPDGAEFRGEAGALTEQRVAVDAGVPLPHMLAACDAVGQRGLVRAGCSDVVVAVDRQGDEGDEEEERPAVEDVVRR